jgi:hypothetical protein
MTNPWQDYWKEMEQLKTNKNMKWSEEGLVTCDFSVTNFANLVAEKKSLWINLKIIQSQSQWFVKVSYKIPGF